MAIPRIASRCRLEPVDLQDPEQFTEIREQRLICGWDHEAHTLQQWQEKQAEGLKNLFWIMIPVNGDADQSTRAGHIALDAYTHPPVPDLARADRSILTIHSFFILPVYRAGGLGRHVMGLLEEMATQEPYGSPNCRFITLCGLSKRHVYDERPEWRGVWARLGQSPPSFSIQEWYEKLGYESWKEAPVYEVKALDGEVIKIWEAFMKKKIEPRSAVHSAN
ncbi:uncharacterized protein N7459_005770 [Penicillium hispanicum]|uniref:uncharacterized protein n=1 Tax=Penicillium hispanicum TaxID=1080232 RepID=UPI002540102A|nr:uncharacterized protein N7459_005770 [Penicillium hispanicum]KAJ5579785.1 hypothetical protein N7459_005770 [Penicillium hispanicum]